MSLGLILSNCELRSIFSTFDKESKGFVTVDDVMDSITNTKGKGKGKGTIKGHHGDRDGDRNGSR